MVLRSRIIILCVSDRVLHAAELYHKGAAGNVLIVENGADAFRELKARGANIPGGTELINNALVDMGISDSVIIILPGNAQSTQQEAMIIRQYHDDIPEIDTLLIVTSSPHTRRASMIFKDVFRKSQTPVCIMCSPSSYTNFNAEKWWKSQDDIETVLLEYLKIANFVIFEKRKLKKE